MGSSLGLSVLRVQFYEGLTADKILYDYNYQRQLLSIQAIQSTLAKNLDGKTINEAMDVAKTIDFYGKDFLIRRPVLESIWGEQRYVLLFDEVDKASEELEYTLLEFLDDFSLSIPQYGTVKAKEGMEPVVVLTSNNYRDLSDALKQKMQLSVSSKKNKRRDCGDFENESRSLSNNHRRGGILSLPVAEPVPETDSVYFRRHHMG